MKYFNKIEFSTDILYLDNNIDRLHLNKLNDKSSTITWQQSKSVITIKID